MGIVIAIVCSFITAVIIAFFWIRGIDYMNKNQPDYKGEDLFGEFDDEDKDYLG